MAKARETVGDNGFSSTARKVMMVDENGLPTGSAAGTLDVIIADAVVVPQGGSLTSTAINVDGYKDFTFFVTASLAATVYVQASQDGTNWYDITTTAGAALTYGVTAAQKNAIPLPSIRAFYLRLTVKNTGAGVNTMSARLAAGA